MEEKSESSAAPQPRLAPVAPTERVELLDILRGFALFGVLWMNLDELELAVPDAPYARALAILGTFLAAAKFITLFSFLFGLGFALQMERAQATAVSFAPVYLRRLLALLLIGLVHAVFLAPGEVLQQYATMGVVLLLLRRRSPRTILIVAALSLAWTASWPAMESIDQLRRPDPVTARTAELESLREGMRWEAWDECWWTAHTRGTYGDVLKLHVEFIRYLYQNYFQWTIRGALFCMFLLGLYAGRRGVFRDVEAHLPFARKVLWWSLGVGVGLNLAWVVAWETTENAWLRGPTGAIGTTIMALFYLSGITLLARRQSWHDRLKPFGPVGRMALTNYLLQSAIINILFYGYGFGLYTRMPSTLVLPLAILVFAGQVVLSKWWIERFRFGPAEWLWRSVTYWKLQPMRTISHG